MRVIFTVAFLAIALVVSGASVPSIARPVETPGTCSCSMPTSIRDGYETDTAPVFKAEAVEVRDVMDSHYTYTVMRVKVVFRGCTPANEYILVKSPKTEAACGVTYTPGLPASMEVYMATSCSYNRVWSDCPYDDKVYLYYKPVRGCPTA